MKMMVIFTMLNVTQKKVIKRIWVLIEIEKEVDQNDPVFNFSGAKITIEQARTNVLAIHPGKVVNEEREMLEWMVQNNPLTYEFDIQTKCWV